MINIINATFSLQLVLINKYLCLSRLYDFYCHIIYLLIANLENVICEDIDILIHARKICPAPLTICNKTGHVLDLQDSIRNVDENVLQTMDAEIFLSKAATEEHCRTKFCLRLSSTFDLGMCYKSISDERKKRIQLNQSTSVYRLIGLVGNAKVYGTIGDALQRANISFIRESRGKAAVRSTCNFYSQISLAIAWSPYIDTNMSRLSEYRKFVVSARWRAYWHGEKPSERFITSNWFGIPIIGYSNYSSFQAYGNEMLCNTDSCVLELIARIDRGEMDETIAHVRARVKADTSLAHNGNLLRTFLYDVYNWKLLKLQVESSASTSTSTSALDFSNNSSSSSFSPPLGQIFIATDYNLVQQQTAPMDTEE